MNAPQKVASAESFAKRYAFNTPWYRYGDEDDDATAGGKVEVKLQPLQEKLEACGSLEELKQVWLICQSKQKPA